MKFTFKNGIHPKYHKELAKDKALEEMPTPQTVLISMAQHIGAPAVPVVSVGDEVRVGTLIGAARENALSCNVHSSVSGKVLAIVDHVTPMGGLARHVEIENDGQYTEEFLPTMTEINAESVFQRIKDAGIVGMGGATFPTAAKLRPAKPVDTLIVNGAECEPYICCDNRIMLECAPRFIQGVELVMMVLGVERAIIGVEKNKPLALKLLRSLAKPNMQVVGLETKYPQGAEKQLIYALLKRKVPTGGLPMDVGVVGLNFQTVKAIADAVYENRPLYRRAMTVSGEGIDRPCNLMVRVGVRYSDVYAYCSDPDTTREYSEIISGGPMMGHAQANLDATVGKGSSALLFLTDAEINKKPLTTCINCSRCRKVCPMNLMPMMFDRAMENADVETAKRYGVMNCMECGSCTFVCPAGRHLIQSIRLLKKMVKESK